MAAQADRQTLARRLSFHLLGLPPDYADVLAFEDDPSPNAYDRLLDRFLASPRYGERWARHWMDVARYADNKGYVFEEERRYAYAYTYRDWLVSAFNRDLPYDEFLIQQLAGDHVAENEGNRQAYAAMGFLTLGRRFLNRQPDIIDDRIDVVTRGMLGLTVSCARCHDHKFDPIPIEDYYSLYGVFASSDEPDEKPLLGDPDPTSPDYQAFLKESQERQAKIDAFLEERHQKLRTAPILQAYFTLAHEGRNWDEPQIKSRAQRGKLYERVAVQWRDRIRSLCEQEDPAFVPWKTLAEAVGNEPASSRASGDWLEGIWEKSHPLIWTALSQAKVADMPSLIEIYAGVLAAANQATPHADAEKSASGSSSWPRIRPPGSSPSVSIVFSTRATSKPFAGCAANSINTGPSRPEPRLAAWRWSIANAPSSLAFFSEAIPRRPEKPFPGNTSAFCPGPIVSLSRRAAVVSNWPGPSPALTIPSRRAFL